MKLYLTEDLEIYKRKETCYPNGTVFKWNKIGESTKTHTNKTPDEPRDISIYNENDEKYFLFNGDTCYRTKSDSSGIVKVTLNPNYRSKNRIPLNLNDVINKEFSLNLINKARVTKTKIGTSSGVDIVCDTTLQLEILTIKRGEIKDSLENFLSKDFNKKIKNFTLYLRDIDSRIDLTDVKLKINGLNVPTDYVSKDISTILIGELLDYTKNISINPNIKNHIGNEEKSFESNHNGKINIPIYLGTQYQIELTHPKYHFVEKTINFDEKTLQEIQILMSELGKKVRVEILDKKNK